MACLRGTTASDTLTGGRATDRFVFLGAWGDDLITDFGDGADLLDLRGNGLAFGDLASAAVDADGDGAVDDLLLSVGLAGFGTAALMNVATLSVADVLI